MLTRLALLFLLSPTDAFALGSHGALARTLSAAAVGGGRPSGWALSSIRMASDDVEAARLELLEKAKRALRHDKLSVMLSFKGVSEIEKFFPDATTDVLFERAAKLHDLKGKAPMLIAKGTKLQPGVVLSESPVAGTSAGSTEPGERVMVVA